MALETTTQVNELAQVENSQGAQVAPASDDFVHVSDTVVDVQASTEEVVLIAPDRADVVRVHVTGWDGSGEVEIAFLDDEGSEVTMRGPDDNPDYSTDGSAAIFVEVSLVSPNIEVRIRDTSGASNTVDYNIYIR